ncbi:MAG TPA: hypothetical protein VGL37_03830 [Solirubrobacteraceae bacterium]|jgi:hypothetical protein
MTRRHSSGAVPERETPASIRSLDAVRAPASLHHSIGELVSSAPTRRRRRAPALRLAGAGALAAAAVAAVVLALGGGATPAPTVLEASRVALAPADRASPAENPTRQGMLQASVEGVSFPYWGGRGGWPAAGARSDRLGGRAITTVFYTAHSGKRVGYAIVAGSPLPTPRTGTVVERGGVRFNVLAGGGATIVSWREDGHTCILAARGLPARTLLDLVS